MLFKRCSGGSNCLTGHLVLSDEKIEDKNLEAPIFKPSEVPLQRNSFKKVFWKYAANLQENTHAEVQFHWSCKATLLKHTSTWGFSVNLLHIFRTPFYKNTSEVLLLNHFMFLISSYFYEPIFLGIIRMYLGSWKNRWWPQ